MRHLLTHTAGLSHGVFDPGTMIYKAYGASGVRRQDCSKTMIAERLPALPLLFQPGQGWEYSMAPDVLARLVEIITGQRYIEALQQRLFSPLGMVDTGYVLRAEQVPRMAALRERKSTRSASGPRSVRSPEAVGRPQKAVIRVLACLCDAPRLPRLNAVSGLSVDTS